MAEAKHVDTFIGIALPLRRCVSATLPQPAFSLTCVNPHGILTLGYIPFWSAAALLPLFFLATTSVISFLAVASLKSTLPRRSVSVDSKGFAQWLSPLDATLTEKWGVGTTASQLASSHPGRRRTDKLPMFRPTPSRDRARAPVPIPALRPWADSTHARAPTPSDMP